MSRHNILVSILLVQFGLEPGSFMVNCTATRGGLHHLTTEVAPSPTELEAPFPPADSPRFVTENSSVVTAQIDSTAHLHCVIKNLDSYTVTWVRERDYNLISVGNNIYTNDQRYRVVHNENNEDWMLQIKYVRKRDAGLYMCQHSSNPPNRIFIELKVTVAAKAEISGPPEKYKKLGSILRLVCTFSEIPDPTMYVNWYHNNQVVNYKSDLRIKVTTELETKRSTLVIYSAAKAHSGNYSCVPSNAQPASTVVHILDEENTASMLTAGGSWFHCPSLLLLGTSLMASLCHYTS